MAALAVIILSSAFSGLMLEINAAEQQTGRSPGCDAWAVRGESGVRPHKSHKKERQIQCLLPAQRSVMTRGAKICVYITCMCVSVQL